MQTPTPTAPIEYYYQPPSIWNNNLDLILTEMNKKPPIQELHKLPDLNQIRNLQNFKIVVKNAEQKTSVKFVFVMRRICEISGSVLRKGAVIFAFANFFINFGNPPLQFAGVVIAGGVGVASIIPTLIGKLFKALENFLIQGEIKDKGYRNNEYGLLKQWRDATKLNEMEKILAEYNDQAMKIHLIVNSPYSNEVKEYLGWIENKILIYKNISS